MEIDAVKHTYVGLPDFFRNAEPPPPGHPSKPGSQPHNQIAGTLEEQLARVFESRQPADDQPVTYGDLRRVEARLDAMGIELRAMATRLELRNTQILGALRLLNDRLVLLEGRP